jgi:hypothetical protein
VVSVRAVTTPPQPPQFDPLARDVAAFLVMVVGVAMVVLCAFLTDPRLGWSAVGFLLMAAGGFTGTHRGG